MHPRQSWMDVWLLASFSARDRSQVFTHASQVLCHWAIPLTQKNSIFYLVRKRQKAIGTQIVEIQTGKARIWESPDRKHSRLDSMELPLMGCQMMQQLWAGIKSARVQAEGLSFHFLSGRNPSIPRFNIKTEYLSEYQWVKNKYNMR